MKLAYVLIHLFNFTQMGPACLLAILVEHLYQHQQVLVVAILFLEYNLKLLFELIVPLCLREVVVLE